MSNGISTAVSYLLSYAESLLRNRRILVLTGAGVSTNAGLPDYRGQGQLRRESPGYESFLRHSDVRSQYWSSTLEGWKNLASAQPTFTHRLVAQLETQNFCSGVVTQNVDGLHRAAGSKTLVELHGNEETVRCVKCSRELSRQEFCELVLARVRADEAQLHGTPSIPNCECGGLWRPSITFFGEQVDSRLYKASLDLLGDSEAMLILGSSLQVNTGLQLVQAAASLGKPTVLLNLGLSKGMGIVDVSAQVDIDAGMEWIFGKND